MSLENEIIEREKALLTREVRESPERISSLLSDDFREIGTSGAYFGLAKVLTSLPSALNWHCQTHDWQVRSLSDDIVQTTHLALISKGNSERHYSRRSSLWRNESGEWKMVFHQGTPVDPFDT